MVEVVFEINLIVSRPTVTSLDTTLQERKG